MSELFFDSESICSSDPLSSIEEPDFGENLSDDSLNSEDIFPLSYSEEGWNSSDDHSCESFNMSAEVVVSDDDDVVVNKDLKRKPHKTSRGKDKQSSIFIPDGDYGDEIIFVEPENYSPRKKMKLDEEKRTAAVDKSSVGTDSEIAVTFAKKGIEFPHAREHCRTKTFVQIPSVTTKCSSNEEFCDKCYCYVCDDLSSKCELWKTEEKPHCNAYAKHAFWERERNLHKRNLKKFNFVPILTLLAPEKINQEMTISAVVCNRYVDEIQEVSNSTTNVCYCQVDPLLNPFGCQACRWERGYLSLQNKSKMQGIVLNATIEVEKHLQRKQPNPAIVILDTITSLLLGVDINSKYSIFIPEKDSSRLTSLWIEAALNRDADQDLLSKAKERLSKSVKDSTSQLFLPEAKKIHEILSELRPYDDPLVVKCLMKNYKGSSGLKESYEVTKVRLQYFKANNKISEAINYILGVETPGVNSMLCDYHELRDELVDLLITKGRMQEALTVCKTHFSNKLPTDLHVQEKTSNGKTFNFSSTPTKSISINTFKNLFLGLA
ncbi:uncharacterized protein LOC116289330, partial [Actinia tenebrosa]|uniref:Uncharacterized protein LOC116289330 n=1 Tax=Actinia tenebrosa TaxID=6105 RepID=A0A6P8H6Q7_ACTTE